MKGQGERPLDNPERLPGALYHLPMKETKNRKQVWVKEWRSDMLSFNSMLDLHIGMTH